MINREGTLKPDVTTFRAANGCWGYHATIEFHDGSVMCIAPTPAFKSKESARKYGRDDVSRVLKMDALDPVRIACTESRPTDDKLIVALKVIAVYLDDRESEIFRGPVVDGVASGSTNDGRSAVWIDIQHRHEPEPEDARKLNSESASVQQVPEYSESEYKVASEWLSFHEYLRGLDEYDEPGRQFRALIGHIRFCWPKVLLPDRIEIGVTNALVDLNPEDLRQAWWCFTDADEVSVSVDSTPSAPFSGLQAAWRDVCSAFRSRAKGAPF